MIPTNDPWQHSEILTLKNYRNWFPRRSSKKFRNSDPYQWLTQTFKNSHYHKNSKTHSDFLIPDLHTSFRNSNLHKEFQKTIRRFDPHKGLYDWKRAEILIPTKNSKKTCQKFLPPERTQKKSFSIQKVWFSQTTPKNVQKFLLFSINNSWNLQASSAPIKNFLKHSKILIPQTEFQNVPFRNVKSLQRTPNDKLNIWSLLSNFKLKTCRYFDPHKELTNWRQSEIKLLPPERTPKLTFRNSDP